MNLQTKQIQQVVRYETVSARFISVCSLLSNGVSHGHVPACLAAKLLLLIFKVQYAEKLSNCSNY